MTNTSQPGTTRRSFVRNMALTFGILMVTLRIGANKKRLADDILGCGPAKNTEPLKTMNSVKSGDWSDAATWGGSVPSMADTAVISQGHSVVFDAEKGAVAGIKISANAILSFDKTNSCTLECTENVVVEGKLKMRPASASVKHTLRFTGIDERRYEGGGMEVLATDVGLWVMGAGALELVGTSKTSWTKASAALEKGSTSVPVEEATGWAEGDELCIAPTEPPTAGNVYLNGFDEVSVGRISGNAITASKQLSRPHPKVNDLWTAEVMNLTRNVCIEGTPSGKAHIFIRSTSKQFVLYTALRYMGPRKDRNGDGITELVAGRYGLHFHHCFDGSRGSLVKGNVIRDTSNHSYVPHMSHEVYFKDNVSYNTLETSFWWDPGDPSHDVVYDHNIVAKCNFIEGSLNMNAEDAPSFSSSGFGLNTGDGNVCNNNVVVGGSQGDFADGGAYNWEAVINEGVWIFSGNISHNNGCGLRIWQNSTRNHVIENFTSYHNGMGLFHGAYANSYTYNKGILYGNALQIKAASVNSNRVRIENFVIDGAGIIDNGVEVIHSPLPGERPVFLRNLTVRNCKSSAILDSVAPEVHSVDVIDCDIQGNIVLHPLATANEVIRVQPKSGSSYAISKSGTINIGHFAPAVWGEGIGLKGEYFNSNNFTNPAFTRTDSNISFSEWSAGVHYAITSNTYSVRWTGQIQPQYSEDYTFTMSAGGGFRLWIDNTLLLDNWKENFPGGFDTAPVKMEAGKLYDIKVEYFNNDKDTGAGLSWASASLPAEYVPQSQLFSDPVPLIAEPAAPAQDDGEPPPTPGQDDHFFVNSFARNFIEVRSNVNTLYQLFDAQGRLLQKGNIVTGYNQVFVMNYGAGILLLKVSHVSKAYRVLKM